MQKPLLRTVAMSLLLLAIGPASADTELDQLVEQAGVKAGDVAMRDRPGWTEPRKIIVRDIPGFYDVVAGSTPGIELVRVRTEDEALRHAVDADAIMGFCSERLVAAAPKVMWMQIFSAGADRCLALERVASGDIVLTNMQKMSSPVIAEHVTALVLALARNLGPYSKAMAAGDWQRGSGMTSGMQSIGGKTVLVLGLGGIGTESARRLAALDMSVLATRRSSREGPEFVDYVGLSSERFELAAQADFIVNALPLTAETTGILDAEFFAAAKRGAHFVNVGRGKTVVTSDLVAALESGQIAGAGLDVTDPEPLPRDHALWQMSNVIVTPHVAGRGGNRIRHGILAKENLRRFVAGDALLNVVNPELGY
ncbi:MAG: D-2-hydroxyacid dehydrogenase [Gammaproteobacteria bacterium]|jgi:phosphoglycerate dehydrogenase-like enzyme|nr:D-2-hydroxyacid dehydrogenase [Gammaproteobacteria bacterium]MDH3749383.1 D-2-hydroxyacid dehydrogenase [Gammaproteobacteria bacterium]MDH3804075.1 D-2-hydroxyacid dehydrogenase [Gammaproteobacteria bacterium]